MRAPRAHLPGLLGAFALTACLACRGDPPPRAPEQATEPAQLAEPQQLTPASAKLAPRPDATASPLGLAPAPPDAHACERSCGDLHTCLRVLERGSPAAASTIELGCLEACLGSGTHSPLLACPGPSPETLPSSCAGYTTCMHAAWVEPVPKLAPKELTRSGRGCERACLNFAVCRDLPMNTGDREAIDDCVEKCVAVLDPSQEKLAGECTTLEDCDEVQRCILALARG